MFIIYVSTIKGRDHISQVYKTCNIFYVSEVKLKLPSAQELRCQGVWQNLHMFLTSELDWNERTASRSCRFIACTYWIGDWWAQICVDPYLKGN
jgi:hypothetical protein